MVTEITEGVRVSVEAEYQPEYSSPSQYHYVFTYRVTIENNSNRTIQVMRRDWHIQDAGYPSREVSGEGVVGQQPIIEPGNEHLPKPKALLLDEPFSKLDKELKDQMRSFVFSQIRKMNIPALLVTHDPDDSACEQVINF